MVASAKAWAATVAARRAVSPGSGPETSVAGAAAAERAWIGRRVQRRDRSRARRVQRAAQERADDAARAAHPVDQVGVALGRDVDGVAQRDDLDVRAELRPERGRVGERGERVEVAADDQDRHRRGQRHVRHPRRPLDRLRPVEADVVGLREAADRPPLRAREGLERVGRPAQVGHLRVVEARDREVGAAREVGRVRRRVVPRVGLAGEPQQRDVVAGERRPHRRVELAQDHRVRRRVLDHVGERARVDAYVQRAPVRVLRATGQRRRRGPAPATLRAARPIPARPSRARPARPRPRTRTRGRCRAAGRRSRARPSAASRGGGR